MTALINIVIGVGLSAIYFAATIRIWQKRSRLWALLPLATTFIYVLPTSQYIMHLIDGTDETNPLHWTVLLFVLPGLLTFAHLRWLIRDDARAGVIVTHAQQEAVIRDAAETVTRAEERQIERAEDRETDRAEDRATDRAEDRGLWAKARAEDRATDREDRETDRAVDRIDRAEDRETDRKDRAADRAEERTDRALEREYRKLDE